MNSLYVSQELSAANHEPEFRNAVSIVLRPSVVGESKFLMNVHNLQIENKINSNFINALLKCYCCYLDKKQREQRLLKVSQSFSMETCGTEAVRGEHGEGEEGNIHNQVCINSLSFVLVLVSVAEAQVER